MIKEYPNRDFSNNLITIVNKNKIATDKYQHYNIQVIATSYKENGDVDKIQNVTRDVTDKNINRDKLINDIFLDVSTNL